MSTNNFSASPQKPETKQAAAGPVLNLNRALIKSTSIIALGTFISRVLGFLRDIVLARLFGTAATADAFFVANRIPNLFRDLAGEGATNAAVVPVLSEYAAKKDKEELWSLIGVVFSFALIILSLITIIGIVFAPWIVRLIAPGFIAEPEKLKLTIQLTRIMFPYLVLIGLTAYSMGILYTFRSFFSPAFSPCLLNIAMILSAYIASRTMEEPIFGLAIGVLAGGVAQLLVQLGPMARKGVKFIKPKTLSHPGARKIGTLLLPRLFGSAIYQLNVFVDTFCASLASVVGGGAISAIYYANRIIQFPMGVFSISLASALLPTMSELSAKNDTQQLKKTLVFSLENIFLVMLPMSAFIMILSTPMVRVFFQRGAFDSHSTQITSLALLFYAIGLVSFGGVKVMVTIFYALQDTRTPVGVAGIALIINLVLNFALMGPLKVGGIALANVVSATFNFLTLFYLMNKRLGGISDQVLRSFIKILAATVTMAVAVALSWEYLMVSNELLRLMMTGMIALCVFGAMCFVLKVGQAVSGLRWLSRKIKINSAV
ncbi:MAG TPA: murein biosynthesis integral membrane protein MurJ [Candidatus Omnitrophota bacterium]|nr:murein biosynthesis integral membrane protein MurJ [Candidatus Omnitrophota bacterium]HPD84422.1 murein biosynthesis integral membrane protein MurJ [Candidatus Omnitrophota bacterium]HRZ03280.1 murein biosynthesis integral membrane protein MurJ [Candidatus Omnitrophota bacterium]